MSYLVIVTGSRDWKDLSAVYEAIADTPKCAIFMQGGCPTGADKFARMACEKSLRPMHTEKAHWYLYKLAAGPMRNRRMMEFEPDEVIAFLQNRNDSPGTIDCVNQAELRGIKVRKIGDWE